MVVVCCFVYKIDVLVVAAAAARWCADLYDFRTLVSYNV